MKNKLMVNMLYYIVFWVDIVAIAFLAKYFYGNLLIARWEAVFALGVLQAFSLMIFGMLLSKSGIIRLFNKDLRVKVHMKKTFQRCIVPMVMILFVWGIVLLKLFFEINFSIYFLAMKILLEYPIILQLSWIIIGYNIINNTYKED